MITILIKTIKHLPLIQGKANRMQLKVCSVRGAIPLIRTKVSSQQIERNQINLNKVFLLAFLEFRL